MADVTIRFFEFSFLVHSSDRLTVLFPAAAHGLLVKLTKNGVTRVIPVPFGSNLELRDAAQKSLALGAPTMNSNYIDRVPEVNDVEGTAFTIESSKIDPTAAPKSTINAKFHVSGGVLTGQLCSIAKYQNKQYKFTAKTSEITDTVDLVMPGGVTYHLFLNGASVLQLDDTDVLEFNNADALGAPSAGFYDLAEYIRLLNEVGLAVSHASIGAGIGGVGIDNVCANARLNV